MHVLSKVEKQLAFLGALSLFLAGLEYLFPKPLPFIRLGLANIPFLLALPYFNFKQLFLLSMIKTLGQGILNGTLASYIFLFSLSGTLAGCFLMYISYKLGKKYFSLVGISIIGSLGSNLVQNIFSVLFIFGESSWVILPFMMIFGLFSGLLIGVLTEFFRLKLFFIHVFFDVAVAKSLDMESSALFKKESAIKSKKIKARLKDYLSLYITPKARLLAGLCFGIGFFIIEDVSVRCFFLLIYAGFVYLSGKRLMWLYFGFFSISIIFFNLLVPFDYVYTYFLGFPITEGALVEGINKSITLLAFIFISLFSISPALRLPTSWGNVLSLSFIYVERLYNLKKNLSVKQFFPDLDDILLNIWDQGNDFEKKEVIVYNKLWSSLWVLLSFIVVAIIILLNIFFN